MKAWRYLIAFALVASGGAGAQFTPQAQEVLLLAPQLLASQGIQDPTPEQLRAALVGGAVATPSGAKVSLRGVLDKGR